MEIPDVCPIHITAKNEAELEFPVVEKEGIRLLGRLFTVMNNCDERSK
jgi:hypothetical protein